MVRLMSTSDEIIRVYRKKISRTKPLLYSTPWTLQLHFLPPISVVLVRDYVAFVSPPPLSSFLLALVYSIVVQVGSLTSTSTSTKSLISNL